MAKKRKFSLDSNAERQILSYDPPEPFPFPTLSLRSCIVPKTSPKESKPRIKKEKQAEDSLRASPATSPSPGKRSRTTIANDVARSAAAPSNTPRKRTDALVVLSNSPPPPPSLAAGQNKTAHKPQRSAPPQE